MSVVSRRSSRSRTRGDIGRPFNPDAERAHILGELGEVHRIVGPQLTRLRGLLAAIGAVEAAL